MGSPKLNTWLEIKEINNVRMLLEDNSCYEFRSGRPEAWKAGDGNKIMIKEPFVRANGPIEKKFMTVYSAINIKGGESRPVSLDKSLNPPQQPSELKRFNTIDDVELGIKYFIEEVDSKSNITVGSRKFTLNPLTVKGDVDNLDWQPKDIIVITNSVSKNKNNVDIENLTLKERNRDKESKNFLLNYYFP